MSSTSSRDEPLPHLRPPIMERFSQAIVAWAEKWFPDAYVFVVIACAVVGIASVIHSGDALATSQAFGDGFWSLIPFTVQMAMVAVTGYVLAMSPLSLRS